MARRTFQVVAVIAAVALAGTVTVAVIASGGSESRAGGLPGRLHALAQHLHGGGGQADPMAAMIERLHLTAEQIQRFEKIAEIVEAHGGAGHESMMDLHAGLITQLGRDAIGAAEIRPIVDDLIATPAVAADLTNELVALAAGLDDTQRGILLAHLQDTPSGDHPHGR